MPRLQLYFLPSPVPAGAGSAWPEKRLTAASPAEVRREAVSLGGGGAPVSMVASPPSRSHSNRRRGRPCPLALPAPAGACLLLPPGGGLWKRGPGLGGGGGAPRGGEAAAAAKGGFHRSRRWWRPCPALGGRAGRPPSSFGPEAPFWAGCSGPAAPRPRHRRN